MRIGSSLFGVDLTAQHNLLRAYSALSQSSTRLSTMHRINSGADDPAGLVAVEKLQAELEAIERASGNAARAEGILQTADAALGEVSTLINSIRGNVLAAAGGGLSDAELEATQIEVDAALEAIDRIGHTTGLDRAGNTRTFVFSPDVGDAVTLDLPTISTAALGGDAGLLSDLASGGAANLNDGDHAEAMAILDAAQSQVLHDRAELGAFQRYTVDSSRRLLDAMQVNLSEAKSILLDTDVAQETSQLIRAQVLADAGLTMLAQTAHRRRALTTLLSAV